MQKIPFRKLSIIALFVMLIIIATIGIFIHYQREIPAKPAIPVSHAAVAYGIRLDSLDIIYGAVANNQNLSSLLVDHIPHDVIDRIAKYTGEIFDVRKIKSGNRYARIFSKDSLKRTEYFISLLTD